MREHLPRPAMPDPRQLAVRTVHLVARGVLLVVVLAVAVFAVPQLVGAEHSYVVLSGSMQPTMEPGDVILVDDVDVEAIETGDIVSFRDETGSVTTHRVVSLESTPEGPALVTKGDDNEEVDQGLVGGSALVGRVMTLRGEPIVIPYVGVVVETARSDLGAYALFLVPLTLFVLNEVYLRLVGSGAGAADRAGSGADPADPLRVAGSSEGGTAVGAHVLAEGVTDLDGPPGTSNGDDPAAGADGIAGTNARRKLGHGDLTVTPLVLLVLVPYSGWLTLTAPTALSAMVLAGSAVGLVLVGYVGIQAWRRGGRAGRRGSIARADATLATLCLAVLVPFSGWMTVTRLGVLSAMVAAGSLIGLALLAVVRLQLWRHSRDGRQPDEEVDAA